MKDKKAFIMTVKFLMSTLIALILFYFIMFKACSFLPMINDKAEKTINDVDNILEGLEQAQFNFRRYTMQIPDKKMFYFFENGSRSIELRRQAEILKLKTFTLSSGVETQNTRHIISRPLGYCHPTDPCFCYCDSLIYITKDNECNLQIGCRDGSLVCTSSEFKFKYQELDEAFFEELDRNQKFSGISWSGLNIEESTKRVLFSGGFILSPEITKIKTTSNRMSLVFERDKENPDTIWLCSKDGTNCDKESYNNILQKELSRICPS